MKNSRYMDRAAASRDPRFARVLGKLGYERRDMVARPAPMPAAAPSEIEVLREAYQKALGKRPFNGWDATTLREKIAAAKSGD
ncbi:hypothetical protein [Brevundimonas sp.]|uniref:hypothetical protein n=1 Tax=Brevundimonas sp. TaxID=1871086 RepID=UPI002D35ACB7|nr:hypothetical protein [Brevundimonas sp.]HYC66651.1 hypothetical protein [Brevundimonas sp.]